MADANGFVRAMKKAARDEREASKPVNVFFGEVQSVNPLKINVEQKLLLGEAQLVLGRNVTDFEVAATTDWQVEQEGEEKRMTIHNALKAGDAVILLRQQEGQKFVVIDRIG